MTRILSIMSIMVLVLLISCIRLGGEITPRDFRAEADSTGEKVILRWSPPVDKVDGYFVYFGDEVIAVIENPDSTVLVHEPKGFVDVYKLYAYVKDTLSDPPLTISIIPIASYAITVYELNLNQDSTGLGFDDWLKCKVYSISNSNVLKYIDFYYTDTLDGSSGPSFYIASAYLIPKDRGYQGDTALKWNKSYIIKAGSADTIGVVPEPTDTLVRADIGLFFIKVKRGDGWHYGYFDVGRAGNTLSISEVKIQRLPGLRVVGRKE